MSINVIEHRDSVHMYTKHYSDIDDMDVVNKPMDII